MNNVMVTRNDVNEYDHLWESIFTCLENVPSPPTLPVLRQLVQALPTASVHVCLNLE